MSDVPDIIISITLLTGLVYSAIPIPFTSLYDDILDSLFFNSASNCLALFSFFSINLAFFISFFKSISESPTTCANAFSSGNKSFLFLFAILLISETLVDGLDDGWTALKLLTWLSVIGVSFLNIEFWLYSIYGWTKYSPSNVVTFVNKFSLSAIFSWTDGLFIFITSMFWGRPNMFFRNSFLKTSTLLKSSNDILLPLAQTLILLFSFIIAIIAPILDELA